MNSLEQKDNYGYWIFTGKQAQKMNLKRSPTDETWDFLSLKWSNYYENFKDFKGNCYNEVYRRKVDVGEGYELVKLSEETSPDCEWTSDGIKWREMYNKNYKVILSVHFSKFPESEIICVRRPKQRVETTVDWGKSLQMKNGTPVKFFGRVDNKNFPIVLRYKNYDGQEIVSQRAENGQDSLDIDSSEDIINVQKNWTNVYYSQDKGLFFGNHEYYSQEEAKAFSKDKDVGLIYIGAIQK